MFIRFKNVTDKSREKRCHNFMEVQMTFINKKDKKNNKN